MRAGGGGSRRPRVSGGARPQPRRRAGGTRLLAVAALVAALVTVLGPAAPVGAQATAPATPSAEEELAQKYAPIAYLKRQDFACDPEGEPWPPAPVEIAFDDPAVALRREPGAEEVGRAPGADDLFGQDAAYFLDLPGDPREPGCGYERHARERMAGREPTVYAHVAVEPDGGGLGLQYWFYYYFNDFNDKHESDWEMIQLLFDAGSAQEALGQEPVSIAFSQHKGGETSAWAGEKLQKEDGHPVTYVARGSHGNYYRPGVWLGWGENGSGLGCDNTTAPAERVAPAVRLVPATVGGAADPFAWSAFGGTWGERESWVFDGPRGPNLNARWRAPVTWAAGLRDASLPIDGADALGPEPTGVFCAVVETAADLYAQLQVYPWLVAGGLLVVLTVAVWLVVLAAPTLAAAWGLYRRHWWTFVGIGAVLIPVGLVVGALHALVVTNPPLERLVAVTEEAPLVPSLLALTLGNLQHLVTALLVAPAVVAAVADVRAGRAPGVRRAYGVVFANLRALVGAGLRATVVIGLLAVSVVGLPWAIVRAVRWAFVAQAVVLDGAEQAGTAGVLRASAAAVAGRWWRTLAILLVLLFVGAVLGPLLGIPVMVFLSAPLWLVNGLGGVVYAVAHPFAIVGGTLLYERRLRA